jgi:putative membrane protein
MILFLLIGIILGIIAGLIPGLHSNNISKIIIFLPFFGTEILVLIIALGITQSFVDFIPSILLGAPDSETYESILPGHKLFLKGRAHEAIALTVFGGILSVAIAILFLPFFIEFIKINTSYFPTIIPVVLLTTLFILVFGEKTRNKKILILFVIIASGTQGLLFKEQIFPLITGYFGLPVLILSKPKEKVKQETKFDISLKNIKESLTGTIGGAIVSIFPGIGNNLAAAIIRTFRQKIKTKNYLVLLGSINTSNFIFSIPVLFFLNKARNGTVIALKDSIFFTNNELFLSITIILIVSGIAGIITLVISKKLLKFSFDFRKIEKIIIFFLIFLVFIFNGFFGLIALFFSTSLGLLTNLVGVKRSSCLASLIIPTLLFYLFF